MKKIQIHLDDKMYKYLKEESLRTGKTISELINEKLQEYKLEGIIRMAEEEYENKKFIKETTEEHFKRLRI
ncbi:ribbon-helix-helix protein, CopG family [Persephonella sp.]